jgi:GT2 family glycosyltransferase
LRPITVLPASDATPKDPPDAAAVDVSVIVVTHNNASLIADCLRAIAGSAQRCSSEVIVVDNGSSDGTLAAIPQELAPSRILALERNVGFARATNAGIAASRGRSIALVNSDAFPDTGSLDRLIETIDELPQAGIVGARLRYPDGRPQPSAGRFPSLIGGLWVALFLHRMPLVGRLDIGIWAHPSLYRRRRRVDWVTAAFCVARRDAGALPTARFMYGEDVEWALQCRRAGLEVWLEPQATAVHIGRASVTQSQQRGFAQERRAHFELAWFGHRSVLAQLLARVILILHAASRLLLLGCVGSLRGARDEQRSEYKALLRVALVPASSRLSDDA